MSFAASVMLLLAFLEMFNCGCRHSYLTICDNMEDLTAEPRASTWKEVKVGDEDVRAKVNSSVNFHNLIHMRKLVSLLVVGQINRIESLLGRCNYESNLQAISFYNNDIQTLETNSVPSLNLKKASFINNNIRTLQPNAFSGKIETLDLSDNKIEAVEEFVFVRYGDGAVITNTLTMRNNRISYIQPKSLPSSLKELNLDRNNLRNIDKDALVNLHELEEITLSHNHLYTIPDISNSSKLKHVDLSYNKITSIDNTRFRNLNQLYFLDLSNNLIRSASWFDVSALFKSKAFTLSVGFNRLLDFDFLNATVVKSFARIEIFLYGNPFSCKKFDNIIRSMAALNIPQNACDLRFQSEGQTPYCLNYEDIFYKDVNKKVEEFLAAIEKNKNLISCSLLPANFFPSSVSCVA